MGKALWYCAGLLTEVPVTSAVDGLPGLRATLKLSGLAASWKVWPAITESGLLSPGCRLISRRRSTPRKRTVEPVLPGSKTPLAVASAVTSLFPESVILNWVLLMNVMVYGSPLRN
ncbi:hypothetical protein D9M71_507200 [compost metagenome]